MRLSLHKRAAMEAYCARDRMPSRLWPNFTKIYCFYNRCFRLRKVYKSKWHKVEHIKDMASPQRQYKKDVIAFYGPEYKAELEKEISKTYGKVQENSL